MLLVLVSTSRREWTRTSRGKWSSSQSWFLLIPTKLKHKLILKDLSCAIFTTFRFWICHSYTLFRNYCDNGHHFDKIQGTLLHLENLRFQAISATNFHRRFIGISVFFKLFFPFCAFFRLDWRFVLIKCTYAEAAKRLFMKDRRG